MSAKLLALFTGLSLFSRKATTVLVDFLLFPKVAAVSSKVSCAISVIKTVYLQALGFLLLFNIPVH
jgi:hypothetical protein